MRFPISTFVSTLAVTAGLVAQGQCESQCSGTAMTPLASSEMGNDIVDVAVGAGSFKTLVKAVQAAGLESALRGKGPLTVFAPTDDAFARLPQKTLASLLRPENKDKLVGILTYHVAAGSFPAKKVVGAKSIDTLNGKALGIHVSDDGVKIGEARVIKTDIRADNGIIHVIDRVLLPPKGKPDIVDTAVKAGKFSTLITAVQAAGLEDALRSKGPLTVFAPVDAAFGKIDSAQLKALLKKENRQKLASILKFHVVAGKVTARDAVTAGSAKTLQGGKVDIRIEKGRVTVNGARVLASDVMANNGVIHVIDSVLLPH